MYVIIEPWGESTAPEELTGKSCGHALPGKKTPMCQSLFLGDITPGILLLNKRQGQARGKGKAVLAEGAWPSNLK